MSPLYPGYSATVYFAPGPICLTLQDGYIPFLVSESSGGGGDADKITLTTQKLEDFPTNQNSPTFLNSHGRGGLGSKWARSRRPLKTPGEAPHHRPRLVLEPSTRHLAGDCTRAGRPVNPAKGWAAGGHGEIGANVLRRGDLSHQGSPCPTVRTNFQ